MTLISWMMLVLGLAIGLVFTVVCSTEAAAITKEDSKSLEEYHELLTKYASLTDSQYRNLSEYVKDQMACLLGAVNSLLDISQKKAHDDSEVLRSFIAVTNDILTTLQNHGDRQCKIMNAIDDLQSIEDSRWNMLYDYIYPKEIKEEDLCNTCRYKALDGGSGDTSICHTCSEAALCNYDPE